MNSRITDRKIWLRRLAALLLPFLLLENAELHAQVVVANPLEWAALAAGNEIIGSQISDEIQGQTQTAVLQGAIAAEFAQVKDWERKYNAYLKDVDGYASSLKAATHLYNDGVRLFINLCDIGRAVAANPQGLLATAALSDLYAETATELVTVYTTLRDAVAAGGETNMLTGAERSQTLWMIEDRLKAFNHRLSQLSLSLRYHTLADVWQSASAGIVDRDNGEIARQAMSRWRRVSQTY